MNWVQRIVRILLSHWSKVHVQNGIPFSSVFLGKQSSNIKWIDVACKSEVCMMWFHQSQLEFKFSQSHTHTFCSAECASHFELVYWMSLSHWDSFCLSWFTSPQFENISSHHKNENQQTIRTKKYLQSQWHRGYWILLNFAIITFTNYLGNGCDTFL